MQRVAFFPTIEDLVQNPYWALLAAGLRSVGVGIVCKPEFSRRWLKGHRKSVRYLHIHFVQQFYVYELVNARLRWVIRLTRNLALARRYGYRTVFTLHNLTPTYPLRPKWVDYLGHFVCIALAHEVIVHCEFARAALARRYWRRKHVHIVNHPAMTGIYPNDISQSQARKTFGLSEKDKVFVFFGGIRPNKGIEQLISAFRLLEENDNHLIIAGKPWPPASYVQELEMMSSGDRRIQMCPQHVPDAEIQRYLNAADAVVLPFSNILTSSSAVLAMTFGKAVIAPSIGCLTELLGDGKGVLYDPGDHHALAVKLQQSDRTELARIGASAQASILSCTAEKMAAKTLEIYQGEVQE